MPNASMEQRQKEGEVYRFIFFFFLGIKKNLLWYPSLILICLHIMFGNWEFITIFIFSSKSALVALLIVNPGIISVIIERRKMIIWPQKKKKIPRYIHCNCYLKWSLYSSPKLKGKKKLLFYTNSFFLICFFINENKYKF